MTDSALALTADQVRVVYDRSDRQILLVPDEIATRIRHETADGWIEHLGTLKGPLRAFARGTWMHTTIGTLMQAFADTPIPEGLPAEQRMDATTNRFGAQHGLLLWPPIVSASNWNDEARIPIAPVDEDLHVVGPELCRGRAIAFKRIVRGR